MNEANYSEINQSLPRSYIFNNALRKSPLDKHPNKISLAEDVDQPDLEEIEDEPEVRDDTPP